MCHTVGRDCVRLCRQWQTRHPLSGSTLFTIIQQQRDHYSTLGEGSRSTPLPDPGLPQEEGDLVARVKDTL